MKVIFLDFDGVIITEDKAFDKTSDGKLVRATTKSCIVQLNRIVRTGAPIVISSSWRKHHTRDQIYGLLYRGGLRNFKLFGQTPSVGDRAEEIKLWLKYVYTITNYVVLDDAVLDIDKDHMVHVEHGWYNGGLQKHHADRAIKILTHTL